MLTCSFNLLCTAGITAGIMACTGHRSVSQVKHMSTALTQTNFNGVNFFITPLTQCIYLFIYIFFFFFLARNKEAVA